MREHLSCAEPVSCCFWVRIAGTWACSGFSAVLPSTVFLSPGVVEVYRVTKRVELGIKATAVCSEKLQQLLKDIDKVWNNLISFMSLAALTVRLEISYVFTKKKNHNYT